MNTWPWSTLTSRVVIHMWAFIGLAQSCANGSALWDTMKKSKMFLKFHSWLTLTVKVNQCKANPQGSMFSPAYKVFSLGLHKRDEKKESS